MPVTRPIIDGLTEGVEGEADGGGLIGELALEVLPETFDGVEFRPIGQAVEQDDTNQFPAVIRCTAKRAAACCRSLAQGSLLRICLLYTSRCV